MRIVATLALDVVRAKSRFYFLSRKLCLRSTSRSTKQPVSSSGKPGNKPVFHDCNNDMVAALKRFQSAQPCDPIKPISDMPPMAHTLLNTHDSISEYMGNKRGYFLQQPRRCKNPLSQESTLTAEFTQFYDKGPNRYKTYAVAP